MINRSILKRIFQVRVFCLRAVCTKCMDNLSEVKREVPQILDSSEDRCSAEQRLAWKTSFFTSPCYEQAFSTVGSAFHDTVYHEICSWFCPVGSVSTSKILQTTGLLCGVCNASIHHTIPTLPATTWKNPHGSFTMPQLVGWGASITGNTPECICAVGLGVGLWELDRYSLCTHISFG